MAAASSAGLSPAAWRAIASQLGGSGCGVAEGWSALMLGRHARRRPPQVRGGDDYSIAVPSPTDDAAIVLRLRAGDATAFDEAFRRWYPSLVRGAEAIVRDRATAEDVAQEVLLELWRRRAALDAGTALGGWLHQAARNRALNHVRHARVQERVLPRLGEPEARDAAAPSTLVAAEMRAAAEAALASLPPRCREVFEMSRGQGLRYAEIAEALGVSVKAVEAQMTRALRTFRERLAPWLPPGDGL